MRRMDPRLADRLVLRALADARSELSLTALHTAVALDAESGDLRPFVAEIGAALVRLLLSGDVAVEERDGRLLYAARPLTRAASNRSVATAISSTAASNTARLAWDGTR